MSVAPIRTLKRNEGGAQITYYDGSTVLGYANVPEGEDVLHPSITVPTKTDKTFVGWGTTTSEANWVGTLTSTGQPMNLYAIYLDNSLTVVSSGTKLVTSYVSGSFRASLTANWNSQQTNKTFTLDKGRYGTATAVIQGNFSAHDVGQYMSKGNVDFDGVTVFDAVGSATSGSATKVINDGSHTLHLYVISHGNYTQSGEGYVKSLVLSNPIAWT